jgi:uncharacterized membrane protein YfcA
VSNVLTLKLNNNENNDNERNLIQKNEKNENLKKNDTNDRSTLTSKIHIGIVSGSFDILSGRIIVGLLESIKLSYRSKVKLTAMCFPTPRDSITDRCP